MGSSVTAVRSGSFEADKRVEGVRQKESENDSHVQGTTPGTDAFIFAARQSLRDRSCFMGQGSWCMGFAGKLL